jgi:hypothetical protein
MIKSGARALAEGELRQQTMLVRRLGMSQAQNRKTFHRRTNLMVR